MPRSPGDTPLVLHIGLPKTATTFLQYTIFKHAPDLVYVHLHGGPDEERLVRLVKRYQRVDEGRLAVTLAKANEALEQIRQGQDGRTTLISNENISLGGTEIWDDAGPTPARVAARIGAWDRSEDPPQRSISVILGVRRQDQWLGSRYAQSAAETEGFDQADFEKRMEKLCAGGLHGSMQWLDYTEAWRQLVDALGRERVLVVPMESLNEAPRPVLERMGEFIGGVPLVDVYDRAAEDPKGKIRRNVTSTGPNTWKLRGSEITISMSEPLSNAILERFKDSNEELGEAIGVDLRSLGYW